VTDQTISTDTTSATFQLSVTSGGVARFGYTTATPAISESTTIGTAITSPAISTAVQIVSYAWAITDSHFSINSSTGVISVAQPLNYNINNTYTLQVIGTTAALAFYVVTVTITIQNPVVTIISPASNSQFTGTVGNSFGTNLVASGGTSPYTFTIGAGSLPPGLNLDTHGSISGTPTTAGTYTVSFRATDIYAAPLAGISGITFLITGGATPIPVPDPVQSSKLTSYTPETVTVGSPTSISATGIFDRTISNISLNGVLIPLKSWTQTATSVVISPLTFAAGTNYIEIFNGAVPLLSPLKLTGTNTNKSAAVALTSSKITYIRCVNGNRIRIAFGHSPSCPSGYAKG
jgi:hypothetical protein